MSLKYIEILKCRVNNKCVTLSMADTNRLKILNYFNIHNKRMKTPLKINDWMNVDNEEFIDFCLSYQESEYTVDATSQSTSSQAY